MAQFCGLHEDEKRPGVPVSTASMVQDEYQEYSYCPAQWAWDKRLYQTGFLPAFRVPGRKGLSARPREVTVFEQITPLR